MSRKFKVGVVGATGAVGREMVKMLADRNFPVESLRLLASERSVGKKIDFNGKEVSVELLTKESG
ncbi:MAG: aspartate-semialdehyde dehydrogenase, partial [Elusimicrobiota bacterium]|nr:aspartate-semialdehyde dehydrogenase [Elusimicrobiota bacterium]